LNGIEFMPYFVRGLSSRTGEETYE